MHTDIRRIALAYGLGAAIELITAYLATFSIMFWLCALALARMHPAAFVQGA